MGEILGIGLSHFPGPLVPARYWPELLRTNVEKGRIPSEVFADMERWPPPMRAEWGADEGVTAAGEHEARLLAGYRGAEITIDGKFMGTTQSTLKLPAGERTVKIEKSGYKEWNRTVTLNAGSSITIDATLEKNPQ